jgi:hypothetical protein
VQEDKKGRRFVKITSTVPNRAGLLRHGMDGSAQISVGRSTVARLALQRVVRWVRPSIYFWFGG